MNKDSINLDNTLLKNSWKKIILLNDVSIRVVLNNLNESGLRICLIVNYKNEFIGTISDGDIRRALIRGISLDDSITNLINKNPIKVNSKVKPEIVFQLMSEHKVYQIPIINDFNTIIGLYTWDQFFLHKKLSNSMFILAGGKGRRLGALTKNCPKPLLLVNGKPMLESILVSAKLKGINNFIISINYLGDMIQEYFGNGEKWNININYVKEDKPLGTAGSLSLINPKPEHPILVSNCDIVTDFNFLNLLDFHNKHDSAATMAVRINEWENPFGVVQTNDLDIIGFEEKPVQKSIINAGVYVLNPEVIDFVIKNEQIDMPDLFIRLKEKGYKTIIFPIHEQWLDIGRPEDFKKINN